jgi:hypothetical protein
MVKKSIRRVATAKLASSGLNARSFNPPRPTRIFAGTAARCWSQSATWPIAVPAAIHLPVLLTATLTTRLSGGGFDGLRDNHTYPTMSTNPSTKNAERVWDWRAT